MQIFPYFQHARFLILFIIHRHIDHIYAQNFIYIYINFQKFIFYSVVMRS